MNRNRIDDAMLNSEAQEAMRDLVSHLPEESLSLAWRSELNDRLRTTAAATRRKKRWTFILQPAFGLAAVGAIAAVVMVRANIETEVPVADGRLEEALVRDHRHSVALSDVVGMGVNPMETRTTSTFDRDAQGWSEVDFDSL